MAEPDRRIELELAVRDSVSATLKAIATNLESVNAKLSRGGNAIQESADTLHKISVHTHDIGENAKQSTRSLLNLGDILKTMVRFLADTPVAIPLVVVAAAGFVGTQMTKLAAGRERLKAMAQDTGFSEGRISILQRFGRRMGFDPEVTQKNIAQIGNSIKELQTGGTGATLFQNMADIGEANFGAAILKDVQAGGSIDTAFDKIADRYAELYKTDAVQAAKFANAAGLPESFLRDIKDNMKGLVPAYEMSEAAAQAWLKKMSLVHSMYDTLMLSTAGFAIRALVLGGRVVGKVKHLFRDRPEWPEITDPAKRQRMGLRPLSPEQLENLKAGKKDTGSVVSDIAASLKRMYQKGLEIEARQGGGPVSAGRDYLVGERGPELLISGGQHQLVGERGPQMLRPSASGEIRTLAQAEADKKLSIPVAYRNPGDIKWGQWAAAHGAIGRGQRGGHAIFATAEEGIAAQEALLRERGQGKSIAEIGKWYAADPKWARGVAKIMGVDPNYRPEDVAILAAAIRRQEGFNLSTRLNASIAFNNVPPGVKTSADADGMDSFKMARTLPLVY